MQFFVFALTINSALEMVKKEEERLKSGRIKDMKGVKKSVKNREDVKHGEEVKSNNVI